MACPDRRPVRGAQMILALPFAGALLLHTACAGGERAANSNTSAKSVPTDTTTRSAKSEADPCALLTPQDAEAVLRATVKKGSSQGLSAAATCQYLREKAGSLAEAGESVTLQVHFGGGSSFDSYVTKAEEAFKTKAQPVPGVGDKAVFNGDQFIVRYKNDFFVILIGKRMTDAERIEAAKALAGKVIARM